MKRIQRRCGKRAAVLSLAGMIGFLTAGSAGLTSAYLSSREAAENKAAFADNRLVIEEPDFDPDTNTDYGTTVYPKQVSVRNTGTVPVYARVRLVFSDPRAEACTSFTNSRGTFPAAELAAHLPPGWAVNNSDDGYFYCTEPLAPGSTAPDLIRTVTTVFGADTERTDYDIYVRAESVQISSVSAGTGETAARTWSDAWNAIEF